MHLLPTATVTHGANVCTYPVGCGPSEGSFGRPFARPFPATLPPPVPRRKGGRAPLLHDSDEQPERAKGDAVHVAPIGNWDTDPLHRPCKAAARQIEDGIYPARPAAAVEAELRAIRCRGEAS